MTGEFLLTGLFFALLSPFLGLNKPFLQLFLRKLEKSSKNIWWFQKKCVPLHPLTRNTYYK